MNKAVLLAGFSVCLLAFIVSPPDKQDKSLPILIFYKSPVLADSLQNFLRLCFTIKKREVLDTGAKKALLSDHFQKFLREQTDFLKEKKRVMNEAEKEEWTNRFMQQPYNHLGIQVFSNLTASGMETDSIKWQIKIPRMDTGKHNLFIPIPDRKDSYASLKDFADTVLASGLLR